MGWTLPSTGMWRARYLPSLIALLLWVLKTPIYCLNCCILECFDRKSSLFHIAHILMKKNMDMEDMHISVMEGSFLTSTPRIHSNNKLRRCSFCTYTSVPSTAVTRHRRRQHVYSQNRWCDIVVNNYMNTIIKLINRYSQRTKLSGGVERTWCKYILSHYSDLTNSLYITH